jgi:hypothetical protein
MTVAMFLLPWSNETERLDGETNDEALVQKLRAMKVPWGERCMEVLQQCSISQAVMHWAERTGCR